MNGQYNLEYNKITHYFIGIVHSSLENWITAGEGMDMDMKTKIVIEKHYHFISSNKSYIFFNSNFVVTDNCLTKNFS